MGVRKVLRLVCTTDCDPRISKIGHGASVHLRKAVCTVGRRGPLTPVRPFTCFIIAALWRQAGREAAGARAVVGDRYLILKSTYLDATTALLGLEGMKQGAIDRFRRLCCVVGLSVCGLGCFGV